MTFKIYTHPSPCRPARKGISILPDRCQIDQNNNQPWPILSVLTGEDLAGLPYAERLLQLLGHGFGRWDVLDACEREGSLESSIRKPAANDFDRPAVRTLASTELLVLTRTMTSRVRAGR
jgi:G:T/U-mismatch repair DNA glycosylase